MLFAAYRSFNNRSALARARIAGCYACLATFTAEQVVGWTHDDTTAVCPHCGIDAVLPNVDDPQTLRAAQERWHPRDRGLGVAPSGR